MRRYRVGSGLDLLARCYQFFSPWKGGVGEDLCRKLDIDAPQSLNVVPVCIALCVRRTNVVGNSLFSPIRGGGGCTCRNGGVVESFTRVTSDRLLTCNMPERPRAGNKTHMVFYWTAEYVFRRQGLGGNTFREQ